MTCRHKIQYGVYFLQYRANETCFFVQIHFNSRYLIQSKQSQLFALVIIFFVFFFLELELILKMRVLKRRQVFNGFAVLQVLCNNHSRSSKQNIVYQHTTKVIFLTDDHTFPAFAKGGSSFLFSNMLPLQQKIVSPDISILLRIRLC